MKQNRVSIMFSGLFGSVFIAICMIGFMASLTSAQSANPTNQQSSSESPIESGQIVVVVLDDSGSMKDRMRTANGRIRRLDAAKQALELVVDRLPDDTQLGVLLFNGSRRSSKWLKDLGPLERATTKAKIRKVTARGGTPLGRAMKQGIERLLEVRSEKIYGTYRLLVITDGEATDGGESERLLPDILSRGVLLDVIGVDMAKAHSLASRAHSYREADDLDSFKKAVTAVFAESADDDSVDGETDFEVLNAIPDDVAEAVLRELSAPRNDEIEESTDDSYGVSRPAVPRLFGFGILEVACCLSPVVVIISIVVLLFIVIKSQQRR